MGPKPGIPLQYHPKMCFLCIFDLIFVSPTIFGPFGAAGAFGAGKDFFVWKKGGIGLFFVKERPDQAQAKVDFP